MLERQQLSRLADLISSLMAKNLGRGPVEVKVQADAARVTLYLHGVLTAQERLLVRCGRDDLVVQIWNAALEATKPEFQELFAREFGMGVWDITGETDCEEDKRVLTIHLEPPGK